MCLYSCYAIINCAIGVVINAPTIKQDAQKAYYSIVHMYIYMYLIQPTKLPPDPILIDIKYFYRFLGNYCNNSIVHIAILYMFLTQIIMKIMSNANYLPVGVVKSKY